MTPARALPTGAIAETLSTPGGDRLDASPAAPGRGAQWRDVLHSVSVGHRADDGCRHTGRPRTARDRLDGRAGAERCRSATIGRCLSSRCRTPVAGNPVHGESVRRDSVRHVRRGDVRRTAVIDGILQRFPAAAVRGYAATSGAVPTPQAPAPLSSAPANPPAAPVKQDARKKSNTGLLVAALLVVVAGVGAFVMLRPRPDAPPAEVPPVETPATPAPEGALSTAPPTTTDVPPVSAPAAAPQVPSSAAPPAAPSRGGASTPGVPAPAGVAVGAPAAAGAPVAAARGAADPPPVDPNAAGRRGDAARGATAGRRGSAPVDDSLLAVADMRVLVVDGRKSKDEEIILNFGDGKVVLVGRRSGTPVATLPYRSIAAATYVRARNPRWNATLVSPPDDLDVGGLLRTAKHWLTLQTKDGYQVLRLEDVNVLKVLQAVEARYGPGDRAPHPERSELAGDAQAPWPCIRPEEWPGRVRRARRLRRGRGVNGRADLWPATRAGQ